MYSPTGLTDGGCLTATFDLVGKTPCVWNLMVTNSGGGFATRQNAFTVEEGGEAKLWVEIIGRDQIRVGRPQKYII